MSEAVLLAWKCEDLAIRAYLDLEDSPDPGESLLQIITDLGTARYYELETEDPDDDSMILESKELAKSAYRNGDRGDQLDALAQIARYLWDVR
jgi:hypothetical protein